jgi:hypothetical protein
MCGVFMDATFHGGSNDTIGGRGRLRRFADLSLSTFSYPWQLPTSVASLSLSPVTNFSPVLLTPLNNFSPAITEKLWQGLIAGVNDTGDEFFAGFVDTAK